MKGSLPKSLEAEAEAELMGKCYLQAYLACFLIQPKQHIQGWHHLEWTRASCYHNNSSKNYPTGCLRPIKWKNFLN